MQLINCRLRLTLQDGRVMVGQLLAYDKHMNLVLADCEEFRRTRSSTEQRRTLGLIMLRGHHILTLCPEGGPPNADMNRARIPATQQMGPGAGRAVGRVPPPGAPVGISGPVPGMYAPVGLSGPGMYAPGMPGMPMPPRPQ
jgi:small nuclear ribonucleoprotein B and B'